MRSQQRPKESALPKKRWRQSEKVIGFVFFFSFLFVSIFALLFSLSLSIYISLILGPDGVLGAAAYRVKKRRWSGSPSQTSAAAERFLTLTQHKPRGDAAIAHTGIQYAIQLFTPVGQLNPSILYRVHDGWSERMGGVLMIRRNGPRREKMVGKFVTVISEGPPRIELIGWLFLLLFIGRDNPPWTGRMKSSGSHRQLTN